MEDEGNPSGRQPLELFQTVHESESEGVLTQFQKQFSNKVIYNDCSEEDIIGAFLKMKKKMHCIFLKKCFGLGGTLFTIIFLTKYL